MSDQTTHATIRADVGQFQKMLKQSSLDPSSGSDDRTQHSDVYLCVLDNEVRILQVAPGEVVLTYCSFGEDFFDEITLNRDIREMTGTDRRGEDFTYRVGAEAILDVEQTLTYLGFASEGGTIELHLTGTEDRRLSQYARAEGALEAWVKLPGSETVLEDVPHWLPLRFNQDNKYTNTAGDPAPTQVETKVQKVETIIDAVKADKDAEYYPIVVKDETFYVDIGDQDRSGVSGSLGAKGVVGPDVESYYFDGFEEIFSVLSGPVTLQTAPGENPLAVVQEGDDDRTIRHANGTVNN
jgi:hypothetical protein